MSDFCIVLIIIFIYTIIPNLIYIKWYSKWISKKFEDFPWEFIIIVLPWYYIFITPIILMLFSK